uniref:Uncharacterized protein n=1 Tax=Daphnia galeata TaxID=27404 RepID=A0A8J2RB96_9CRUS|nr:unnamed protein product [Daphnia galeata]
MPRNRGNQVKSLRELCLDYVSKIVEDWTEEFQFDQGSDANVITLLQQGEDEELFNKYFKPILDILPPTLSSEIADRYPLYNGSDCSDESELLWCYMKMLVRRKIYFVGSHTNETLDGLLQVASFRCPLLISLKISADHDYPDDDYIYNTHKLEKFLPRFEKLQDLDIAGLDVEDSCLEVLGTFCKDLRKLNVENCKKVTDVGIKALCVSVDHMGKANEALGQCKSIVKLWTIDTQVTIFGIHIALKNLPKLIYWDMVTFQTLIEMHEQMDLEKEFVEIPRCFSNCSELEHRCQYSAYISGSLKMVLPFCPFLSEVRITTRPGFKDADLMYLVYLEKLSKLVINDCHGGNEITFDYGIIPLLKAIGRNLIDLDLIQLRTPINITAVGELCPNLQKLFLCDNRIYTSMLQPKFEMKKLKDVSIYYLKSCEIPSENLAFLLSSPLLQRINLKQCDALTDDHLLRIAKVNPFLKVLSLRDCNSITEKGVNVFMQENEISKMHLSSCRNISPCAIMKWKREALQKNWDLHVVYNY